MKILILQLETRNTELLSKLMNYNKQVCESNDIEYINLNKSSFHSPVYWNKIFEMQKIINEKPYLDYIFWVDSDAFLINCDKNKLINFLEKNKQYSCFISSDMPPWESGEFNAGVFIIKNDEYGKKIIDTWLSIYEQKKDKWQYDSKTNNWHTDSIWAGEDYEQGAFVKYILKNDELSPHIMVNPYFVLNNNNCNEHSDETLLVHLAGMHKDNKETLNSCLEKLNISHEIKDKFENIYLNDTQYDDNIYYIILISIIIAIILIFVILYCNFIL